MRTGDKSLFDLRREPAWSVPRSMRCQVTPLTPWSVLTSIGHGSPQGWSTCSFKTSINVGSVDYAAISSCILYFHAMNKCILVSFNEYFVINERLRYTSVNSITKVFMYSEALASCLVKRTADCID